MLKWWKRKKKKQEKCEEVFVGAIVKIRGLPNKFMVMRKLSNKWCVLVNIDNHCDERTVNIGYIKLVKAKEEINMGNNKHNFVVGDWVVPVGTDFGYTRTPHYSEPDFSKPMQVVRVEENSDLYFGDNAVYVAQDDKRCWFKSSNLKHAFKNGDEVEGRIDGEKWGKGIFIGVMPIGKKYRYVYTIDSPYESVGYWTNIRPIQPKPTTIEWMGQELSIESAKAMVEGINKKLEEI